MSMGVLPGCTSVPGVHVWCPQRPDNELRSPRAGVTDSCEPLCGCWELNLGPLVKQPVLLTTKLSLQPPIGTVFMSYESVNVFEKLK